MGKSHKKQVIVALSGGVDSSVAAYLLKKQGFKVTGFHLRLFTSTPKRRRRKSLVWGFRGGEKEKGIKKIARAIGMPLIIKDARKEFKKKVVDYFLREYEAGRTPNPCVVCNREIKFKFLFDELSKLKADYVATGHYARISPHPSPLPRGEEDFLKPLLPLGEGARRADEGKFHLFSANDKTKDQSYFLYTLTQKQLAKILFPLGNYKKEEIKKIAKKLHLLHTLSARLVFDSSKRANDKCRYEESQGICFISEKFTDKFLKKHLKLKKGNIVDMNGKILGRHLGLPLYTIGQRRNIRIGGTGPYYVAGKNFRKNELLVVRNFNDPLLYKKELIIEWANWLSGLPKFPLKARVCIRYHHPAVRAIIEAVKSSKLKVQSCKVKFIKPQRAVTPGQAAVIYSEKGEVFGGGIIK